MIFGVLQQEARNINPYMLITGANIDKHRCEKLALPFFYDFFGVIGSSGW